MADLKSNTLNQEKDYYGYNLLIGSIFCFNIVSDTSGFSKWMHDTYPDILPLAYLDGYKYFLELLIGLFADSFRYDDYLFLDDSDITLDRALFYGVPPDKIVPKNKVGKLFVVLKNRVFQMKSASTKQQFRESVKNIQSDIVTPFHKYTTENTENQSPYPDEVSIWWCARHVFHNYLSNMQNGIPLAHTVNPLRPTKGSRGVSTKIPVSHFRDSDFYDSEVLVRGYCYVFEYLIQKLFVGYLDEEKQIILQNAKRWKDVDYFFTSLLDEIDYQNGESYSRQWEMQAFRPRCSVPDDVIQPILNTFVPPSLSPLEELEQLFLWYEVGFLDASNVGFTGVGTFTSLLEGVVLRSKETGNQSPIQIRIICHPGESGSYYSYALLLEEYGFISDRSGWLVCYHCSNDFSYMGKLYDSKIREELLKHESKLEIIEYTYDALLFKRFCLERDVTYRDDVILKQSDELTHLHEILEIQNGKYEQLRQSCEDKQEKIKTALGLVTELLTYYHISRNPDCSVDWNITRNTKEMDVIYSYKENTPDGVRTRQRIIECKYSDHLDLNIEFKKLAEKIESASLGEYAEGVFLFYQRLMPENTVLYQKLMKQYREKGIIIHDYIVLSDEINARCSKKSVWTGKNLDKVKDLMGR